MSRHSKRICCEHLESVDQSRCALLNGLGQRIRENGVDLDRDDTSGLGQQTKSQ